MKPNPVNILQTRKRAGLTMQGLADLMGVTRMTVYNWENGRHPMKGRDFEYMQMKLAIINGKTPMEIRG